MVFQDFLMGSLLVLRCHCAPGCIGRVCNRQRPHGCHRIEQSRLFVGYRRGRARSHFDYCGPGPQPAQTPHHGLHRDWWSCNDRNGLLALVWASPHGGPAIRLRCSGNQGFMDLEPRGDCIGGRWLPGTVAHHASVHIGVVGAITASKPKLLVVAF